MKPKYEVLEVYLGITRRELYHNIYIELENTYGIDIDDIHEEYCFENNLNKSECYPMDAIIGNKQFKDALVVLIDGLLMEFGLMTEDNKFKRKTLFDDFRESNRQ